jgi:hypothetical protein
MAYELHIERGPTEIRLEEWKRVVAGIDGVRLCLAAHSITNPKTHEIISLPAREGDAEMCLAKQEAWHPVFRWFNGRISFKVMLLSDRVSDPIWQVATELAGRLDAIIRGDNGEVYNLKTGKPVS